MQSIIEEIYYGNISPFSKTYGDNPAYKEAVNLRERNKNNLLALAGEQGEEIFEKYLDAQTDIDDIILFDKFTYGLRLGVMLMVELFYRGD